MVSELERSWDGERRREFDAHEIAVFAAALKVPIAYFFLPPPGEDRNLEGMGRSARELHLLLLGRFDTVEILDNRMREFGEDIPPEYEGPIADLPSGAGPWTYTKRRKELIMALLDGMADELDEALDTIAEFADRARQAGIRGYIASQANDADFLGQAKSRPNTSAEEEPADSPTSEVQDDPSDTASASPEPASARQDSR